MTRVIQYMVGVLLLLTLMLIILIGALMTTPGLHWALHGAARWVPGLDITSVSGGWRNLNVHGISYQRPGVTVTVGELHWALELDCLKKSEVCLSALTADQVKVNINTHQLPATSSPSKPWEKITTPYPVLIRMLQVKDVQVTVDDLAINLPLFRSGIAWREHHLTLLPTDIQSLQVILPQSASTKAGSQEIATAEIAAAKAKDQQAVFMSQGMPLLPNGQVSSEQQGQALAEAVKAFFSQPLLPPDLPIVHFPLDVTVERLSAEQLLLSGEQELMVDSLLISAESQDTQWHLQSVEIHSSKGNLFAQGEVDFNHQWPVTLKLNANWKGAELPEGRLMLEAKGDLGEKLILDANLAGAINATLYTEVQLTQAALPLQLTLKSSEIPWPLQGTPEYQAQSIRLRLKGDANNYTLSMKADLSGKGIPKGTVTLEGQGDMQHFQLQRLRLAMLQGNADLSGEVDWQRGIRWQSTLALTGLNTTSQWPDWPGSLSGKAVIQGSLSQEHWQLQVPVLDLQGQLKQNRINIQGNFSGDQAGHWEIAQLHIGLGKNQMDISGKLAQQWALDAKIDAPQLDGQLPGLAGTIKGVLKLRGNLKSPQVSADLEASGIQWQDIHVQRVSISADVHSNQQPQGQIKVRVDQLTQGDVAVKWLTVDAVGQETQHHIQLKMEGDPLSGQLALNGRFDRATGRWQGRVDHTFVNTPVGEWRLSQPILLNYLSSRSQITLSPHCWVNPNAQVCVVKMLEVGQTGSAKIELHHFNLAMIKPFLPEDTGLTGIFNGQSEISWQSGEGLPQAKLSLIGQGVQVDQEIQGNRLTLAFDAFDLNARLTPEHAQLDWLVKVKNNGQFAGKVQISEPQGRRVLSGNIDIEHISMEMLTPLIQDERPKGILKASLQLGGRLQQPQIFGDMRLSQLGIDGSLIPLSITDGDLLIHFSGMSSMMQGVIRTAQGQLNVIGRADWHDVAAWRAQVGVKGERVRVSFPPVAKFDISPDILFEAMPERLTLNGTVLIPWARITIDELPETVVAVSSDEVMLNDQRQPLRPISASIPIVSDLNIHIGDDVQVDGFGLEARLQGDLKMTQDAKGLGLNGQVNIPKGRFTAYGQDLLIRKGVLIFSGPPELPTLNISAIRNPESVADNVTVGVSVTGLADQPKLEVFSEPAMSQQEAISYLLRGQGLDSSGTEGNSMTSALVGIGIAKSGKLVGKIGESFGVNNFSLGAQGVGESSQVVISGDLLPGLQVKYGVGIFDSLATLTLRYRLMPKLYLEAISGVNQALDVLYQFEF